MQAVFRKSAVHLACAVLLIGAADARADVVTDWNIKANDVIVEAKMGTPPAVRTIAIVQTAVYDAVNEARGASVEAAVAAANRATLARLVPSQQAMIDAAYQAALAQIADGTAKTAGIAAGERAAAALLAQRTDDGAAAGETYRPATTAGTYVPTAAPAVPQWAQRKPWLMTSPAQFRPAAPPALASETWARDYNEVKALGARNSARRTAEQTEIARFWEYSLPGIYHGVVRSVATTPGRDVRRNARLLAAASQAMDDALIGVFDAKYHYNYWRPATAIRNGDLDGNSATERDASWVSLIDAPMHPEYPSGHSILASAVATVIKADAGATATALVTTSPSAKGAARRWTSVDDFTQEVGVARIYAGIHYRTAVDVGTSMGQKVGALAVEKFLLVD